MRKTINIFVLLLLTVTAIGQASEQDSVLGSLRWQARVLLVFAPDAEDERVIALSESVNHQSCQAAQRDLLLGVLVAEGQSHVGERAVGTTEAMHLRRKLDIADTDFRVVLVGKDGGAKATYTSPPELEVVFGLIDGMPMRRQEARAQSDSC